jgi:hypothetical protein
MAGIARCETELSLGGDVLVSMPPSKSKLASTVRVFGRLSGGCMHRAPVCGARRMAFAEHNTQTFVSFSFSPKSVRRANWQCSSLRFSQRLRPLSSHPLRSSHARPCVSSLQAPPTIGIQPYPLRSGKWALPHPQQQ